MPLLPFKAFMAYSRVNFTVPGTVLEQALKLYVEGVTSSNVGALIIDSLLSSGPTSGSQDGTSS
jgi:hypothetical protein